MCLAVSPAISHHVRWRTYRVSTFCVNTNYERLRPIILRRWSNIPAWAVRTPMTCPLTVLVQACQPLWPVLTYDASRYLHVLTISFEPWPLSGFEATRRESISKFPPRRPVADFGTLSRGLHTDMDAPYPHAPVGYWQGNARFGHSSFRPSETTIPNSYSRNFVSRPNVGDQGNFEKCCDVQFFSKKLVNGARFLEFHLNRLVSFEPKTALIVGFRQRFQHFKFYFFSKPKAWG